MFNTLHFDLDLLCHVHVHVIRIASETEKQHVENENTAGVGAAKRTNRLDNYEYKITNYNGLNDAD